MHKFIGHFTTITRHKIKVTLLCFKCGLYRQGILHDLSKYSYIEFSSGVKYFQGNRSPIDKEKETIGYSMGWFHHKGRNKHHWEYWLDNGLHGIKPVEIPVKYVIEMFCDRVVASQIYQKDKYSDKSALIYYLNSKDHLMIHPNSEKLIIHLLTHLNEKGLDKTIHYIKNNVL